MYQNKQAFTLIELLVVVLIIGILASVAVPQYQRAVLKSRFAQAKILADSLAQAQEVYYLANSTYATGFNQLDIVLPEPMPGYSLNGRWTRYRWGTCYMGIEDGYVRCNVWINRATTEEDGGIAYRVYLNQLHTAGRECKVYGDDPQAIQLCRADTGENVPKSGLSTTFVYP